MGRSKKPGGGSDDDARTVRASDSDLFPEGSRGSNHHRAEGHSNPYAEASQASEIGRKPYNAVRTQSAESDPVTGNDERGAFQIAQPAVAKHPDVNAADETRPTEGGLPTPVGCLKQTNSTGLVRLRTVEEVATYLNISISTVSRLPSKDPDFPRPIRIGGSARWDCMEVEHFVEVLKARRNSGR
ncbi:MAG: helix-turn-helix transcriptional regulator [Hoeflea sp.]|uniref:helix-turn-helix transcriptional regulator n=1 Tax=Hoeflea sp. TaxID=1940281 RepID=UPI003EF772FF